MFLTMNIDMRERERERERGGGSGGGGFCTTEQQTDKLIADGKAERYI